MDEEVGIGMGLDGDQHWLEWDTRLLFHVFASASEGHGEKGSMIFADRSHSLRFPKVRVRDENIYKIPLDGCPISHACVPKPTDVQVPVPTAPSLYRSTVFRRPEGIR